MTAPQQMTLPLGMAVNAPGATAISSTHAVLVGDSNGDFLPDFITGSQGAGGVGIHLWHATPRDAGDVAALPTPTPLAWGHYSLVDQASMSPVVNLLDMVRSGSIFDMAFFDGDGNGDARDVAVTTSGAEPAAWLRHSPNGDLVTVATFPTSLTPIGGQAMDPNNPWCILQLGTCSGRIDRLMVEADDFDGDGDDDIVFAGSLLPGAAGSFGAFHILLNDLDNEGWTEMRLPIAQIATLNAQSIVGLHLFDAALDGDADILVVQTGNDILLVNDGTGSFTVANLGSNSLLGGIVDCVTADIDNDGDDDILIVSQLGSAPVAWYQNLNGTAGVTQYAARANLPVTNLPAFLPNGYSPAMAVGDVNEDCMLDIVFGPAFPNVASRVWLGSSPSTGWTMDDRTSFYIGRDTTTPPDGCFDGADDYVPGAPPVISRPRTASLFDVDLDSDLDFVFGTDTSGVTIYTNSSRCLDSPPQISMASVDLTTGQPCSAAQAEWRYRASNWVLGSQGGFLGAWIDFLSPVPAAAVPTGIDSCGRIAFAHVWMSAQAVPLAVLGSGQYATASNPPSLCTDLPTNQWLPLFGGSDIHGVLSLPNPMTISGGASYRLYSHAIYTNTTVSYFRNSSVNVCEVRQ